MLVDKKTIFISTGKNFKGESARACMSSYSDLVFGKNRLRSILMEQRNYPTCRIELTKSGGAKEVYSSAKSNVNG